MFLSVSSATNVLDRRSLVGALKRQANFTRAVYLSCPSLCEATNVNRVNNWLWFQRRLLKKVQFQTAGRRARRTTRSSRCRAFWGNNRNNAPPPGGQERPSYSNEDDHSRKATLLRFVKGVRITADGPTEGYEVPAPVLAAMRQTVTNLLGTLPPQYFKVTISTRGDNLAQLMFSVLMTGYMFCNAWYRMQLSENMIDQSKPAALVSTASGSLDELIEEEDFDFQGRAAGLAAGSQKLKIQGQVLRWHHEDGVQEIPALEYIEQLEAELAGLKAKLHGQKRKLNREKSEPRSFGNELLDYMKGLTSDQVTSLTECASADVLEAMNALIDRLLGGEDDPHGYHGAWAPGKSECTATELGHALYCLLIIGHELRNLEVRTSLTASLKAVDDFGGEWGGPQDGAGGPPSAAWVPRLPPGK